MKVLTNIVYSPVQLSLRVPWGFEDVAPYKSLKIYDPLILLYPNFLILLKLPAM